MIYQGLAAVPWVLAVTKKKEKKKRFKSVP
jgi:hypothetical protein